MFQHDEEAKLITLENGAVTYAMPEDKLWIGVDFDGTLAYFDHWRGVEHTGEPLKPMVDKVRELIVRGKDVRIFTARVNDTLRFIKETYALPYSAPDPRPDDNRFEQEDKQRARKLKAKIDIDDLARSVLEQWSLINIGRVIPLTNSKDCFCRGIYDDICIQMVPNTGQTLAVEEQAEYLADKGAKPNET